MKTIEKQNKRKLGYNKLKSIIILALFLALLSSLVFADGWPAAPPYPPSHATLYTDTITSKTDGSSVRIADANGLYVTGSATFQRGSISSNTAGDGIFIVKGKSGNRLILGANDAHNHMSIDQEGDVGIGYSEYTTFTGKLSVNGNVGIGTANPKQTLNVVGTLNVTSTSRFENSLTVAKNYIYVGNAGGNYIDPYFSINSYDGGPGGTDLKALHYGLHLKTSGYGISLEPAGNGGVSIVPSGTGDLTVTLDADSDLNVGSGKLYVNGSSGNVGIGTTKPSEKLDVEGNVEINAITRGLKFPGYTTNWEIGRVDGSNRLSFGRAGTEYIQMWDNPKIEFVNTGTIETTAGDLILSPVGNVGIGTTNPREKLDVNGNVIFSFEKRRYIEGNIAMDGSGNGNINLGDLWIIDNEPFMLRIELRHGSINYRSHISEWFGRKRKGTGTSYSKLNELNDLLCGLKSTVSLVGNQQAIL